MKSKRYVKKLAISLVLVAAVTVCSSCSKKGQEDSTSKNTLSAQNLSSAQMTVPTETPAASSTASTLDNTKIGWGPGSIREHNRPTSAESSNTKYAKYDAIFIGEDNKNVYLTFDEGYENGYTAPILDTLKQKNVKAMFFVTCDYVKRNPELVKRMIDEGHTVGNHSWTHPSFPSLSENDATDEIQKLHQLVREQFGYEMKYFRFPMGEFSEKMLDVCKKNGYRSVFWSFAYADWDTKKQPDEQVALKKICDSAHNGAIFLLHAVSKTNSNILPQVIDNVKAQGYTFAEPKL